jgi:hypothetical protein
MTTGKTIVAALLGCIALSVPASGQKVGTSSLQFLKVMPTARATAMGDAYVSMARGADAAFWNPAGLSTVEGLDISSTLTSWLFDTRQVAITTGLSLGDLGVVAMQFQFVDYGIVDEARPDAIDLVVGPDGEQFFNPGLNGRSFRPFAYLLGGSFARAFTDRFSAGVSVKYVMESLWSDPVFTDVNPTTGKVDQYKTYADVVLFDFGMTYNTGYRSVRIGVAVQNFGSQVTFASNAYPAPLAFRIGVSGDAVGPDALLINDDVHRLTLAYDLFQPNDYQQQMHLGAEYAVADVVALRVGYKVDYDTEGMTYGAGLHATIAGTPMSLDYSFGSMGPYLTSVHRMSLGVRVQ